MENLPATGIHVLLKSQLIVQDLSKSREDEYIFYSTGT